MQTGEVIKRLRIEKKLTQDELGEMLGVKKSAIQKYESGAITNLKIDCIQNLCRVFEVPPWVFIFSERIEIEFPNAHYLNLSDILSWDNLRQGLNYALLNVEGKKKADEYLSDLLELDKYRLDVK